ncbi:MarR family winged helix-turn-helix transcriptional regulator [Burkholderia catarinensis]|uniref:MarR family winged helix-turn-helix transcriptional regulator n=1 Tax=Burkholderia catarinensis TaxID=1108140 RepID=UPI000911C57C|nr:MarR family transcriptional regulator [Burkholderia catarinensis]KAG8148524.1 hypothetical protein BFF94_037415 [Burkholderia catarinensis]
MEKQRLDNLLGALSLAVSDRIRQAVLAETGMHETTIFALVLLSQRPTATIDTLARLLGLAHSTVVRLVERLSGDGYVERRPGADKRAVILELTSTGRATVDRALSARQVAVEQITARLSSEQQDAMVTMCEQILTMMSGDVVTAVRICRLCDEGACDLERCPVEQQYRSHANRPTGISR